MASSNSASALATRLLSPSANEALFQKYYILATGAAATNPGIAWLDTYAKPNGNLSEVDKVIDAYMASIEKALGRDGALQMVIKNGLGAAISAADAKAINAELAANKISSWSQIFNLAANLKNTLGDTLNAKAQAASSFAASLDASGKVDFYAGEAVVNAVRMLLQGTTSSVSSLSGATSALTSLTEALSVAGIQAELWSLSGKEHTTLTNQSRTKRCLFTSLRVSSRQVPLRTSLTHTPTVFQEA